jgi:hypothetical protein
MSRRNFILNPPYREILSSDSTKSFQNELFGNRNIISELIQNNKNERHVWVYENNNEIEACIIFDDQDVSFHVEFLLSNRLIKSQSSGSKLIMLLEDIGKELGYAKIELWALEQKIPYYKKHDYIDTKKNSSGRFGSMNYMYKDL